MRILCIHTTEHNIHKQDQTANLQVQIKDQISGSGSPGFYLALSDLLFSSGIL